MEMTNGDIGDKCWASLCPKPSTHVVHTIYTQKGRDDAVNVHTVYCLEHAIYFAGWLPYCYPGEYELVSVLPPASELFSK